MKRQHSSTEITSKSRRGVATVEFAIILPLFLMLVLGTVEMGSALEKSQVIYASLREAGRLASMDYNGIIPPGSNVNNKITQDIKSFLTASGIPGNQVTVSIQHAGGAKDGQPFDINSTANYMEMFRIKASVPYSAVSTFPLEFMSGRTLDAELVFRKGKVTLTSN